MKRKHHLRSTRNKTSLKLDYILLGVILLVAALLRLWKLGQIPFMHDEFSALFRLQFDNFHDLIQYGVCENDSHPAGVHVFLYYWTKLVGWNAFWVKLPFALMGIGSIYLIYLIGKQWFNRKVGLLGAAFFAVSQFTVFYSQLARPYAAGLFFILLMTYFWNKILFDPKKPSVGTCIGYAVATWLAALAHNFSTAQAGLIFLTGLFFLKKERRRAYWLSGIGALLLYAPHLPVFYHQTFVNGGIGGWLARPDSTFLLDFLQYTMNYGPLFIFAVGLVIILPFILGKWQKRRYPIRWAAVTWFVIVFAMAFVYSLMREPIIQFSTMLFCYPFLVLAAFSLYRNNTMTMSQTAIVIAAILFIGTSTLIVNRRHYDLMYHQGYDQIAVRMQQDHDSLSDIRFATFTFATEMAEFYQAPTSVNNRVVFDRDNEVDDLRYWIQDGESDKLGFGWTDYANPVWETQAVAWYPWLLHEDDWFTSRYLTLSKNPVEGSTYLLHDLSPGAYGFAEGQEWGNAFTLSGDSISAMTEHLGMVADVICNDTLHGYSMVIEVHDAENDSILLWHSTGSENSLLLPGHHRVVDAIRFDKNLRPEGTVIKTFLWNRSKRPLVVNKISYYTHDGNPVLSGLYDPLNRGKKRIAGLE